MRRAYRQRLFISTQGSFSVRLDASSFLITPYQVDRGTLDPEDIVLIKNGRCEAGKTPSRATGDHDAIYRHHPKINALINASPINATAFSVTNAPLDSRTIPKATASSAKSSAWNMDCNIRTTKHWHSDAR